MRAADFTGFDRGERGSDAEHLDVLDYKIQQDSKRFNAIQQEVQSKQAQSETLNKRLAIKLKAAAEYNKINGLARRGKTGKMILEPKDWETVSYLAKGGIVSKLNIDELQKQLDSTTTQLDKEKAAHRRLQELTRSYLNAVSVAPERTQAALDDILHQQRAQRQQKQQRRNSFDR